jgi:hypothetical protein
MTALSLLLIAGQAALAIPYGPILPQENAKGAAPRQAPCAPSTTDEIVVCGKAPERVDHRFAKLRPEFEAAGSPKAEIALNEGSRLGITTESSSIGGVTSNRVMLGLKIRFGKKKR